jgi:hypothetical protein
VRFEALPTLRPPILGTKYVVAPTASLPPRIRIRTPPGRSESRPGSRRGCAISWPRWGTGWRSGPTDVPQAGALCVIRRNRDERTLAGGAHPRRLVYAVAW